MAPLVSVLIPAYNAEKWVRSAILSASSQTWKKTEVIVVDDGSSDNTLLVAKSLESKRVKVATQINRGASAARNRALGLAQGEYIQWLDADDLLASDKIALQLRVAGSDEAGCVLLSCAYAEFCLQPKRAKFLPNALWRDLSPLDFLLTRFSRHLWMCNSAWLVSRALTDIAGPWDERLSLDDDGEYFARLASKSGGIRFVPEARVFYRRSSSGSLSRSVTNKHCESLLLSIRLCIGYLQSLEDSERTRAAALQFLQAYIDLSDCFYPDNENLFRQVSELGEELGGELTPPRLSWKYRPIKHAFGWEAVRRTRIIVSKVKLMGRVQRDRLSLSAGS
jgi:glycosyltransferase involved in cell wall biosynthesis